MIAHTCRLQFGSATPSSPTLWDLMVFSTPDFLVPHYLPEFPQTHVQGVSGAIRPSHPLSSPSPPTFNLSQHPNLFKWASSLHQVAKVLEFQPQHQSFQWIFRTDFLLVLTDLISLLSVFYNTTVQKFKFFSTKLSSWSNSHIHTWLLEKP